MNINWREIQEIEKSLEFKHRPQGEMCFGFLDKPNQNSQLLKQILQTTLLKTQELWDKAWPGRQSSLGSHSLIWAPDFVRSPVPPQPWGLLLARTSSLMGMHPVPLTPKPALSHLTPPPQGPQTLQLSHLTPFWIPQGAISVPGERNPSSLPLPSPKTAVLKVPQQCISHRQLQQWKTPKPKSWRRIL